MTYLELCALEVEWYEANGKYSGRIRTRIHNSSALRYVVSDYFWNCSHPLAVECIKHKMANYVMTKKTGIHR